MAPGPSADEPLGDGIEAGLSTDRYDTFLIKLLVRRTSGHIVHGQVMHVPPRRTLRFKDPSTIMRFIMSQIGPHSASDASAGESDET